jgi:hypothetical protein
MRRAETLTRLLPPALTAALALALCAPLLGQTVETRSFGVADYTVYRTWSWGTGTPAADPRYERHLRERVEHHLGRRDWSRAGADGDLELRTYAASVGGALGLLRIDVIDRRSGKLAWQAQASTRIADSAKEKAVLKRIDKIVKAMFADFPRAAP